jgi:hypothetical protein
MQQPVKPIACPRCGAALGAPTPGGEYVCAYCASRSVLNAGGMPPAQVGAQPAPYERAQVTMAQSREIAGRLRAAQIAGKRSNAIVMFAVGGTFGLIGLVCFGMALTGLVTGGLDRDVLFAICFGSFWCLLAGLLCYIGLRYHRSVARERRLRAIGTHGTATVVGYQETAIRVDGCPRVHLSLRVVVPQRGAWDVQMTENVPRMGKVVTGASLPILVNPSDPTDMLVDWWAM